MVHTIALPVFDTPRAPCVEQNAPGVTPCCTAGFVGFGVGLRVGGFVVFAGAGVRVGGLVVVDVFGDGLRAGVVVGLTATSVGVDAAGVPVTVSRSWSTRADADGFEFAAGLASPLML
ncbi:hypothetical protein AB0J14_05175 [Micromonospora arborensis]|uniref:hypothetical protein n=1 Tax=Micromonospora arborensis TaxID=2116518 RepID=UPI0033D251D6